MAVDENACYAVVAIRCSEVQCCLLILVCRIDIKGTSEEKDSRCPRMTERARPVERRFLEETFLR